MVQGEKEDQTSAEKTWQEGGAPCTSATTRTAATPSSRPSLKNGLVVSIERDNIGVKELRSLMSQVDLNNLGACSARANPEAEGPQWSY